MRRCLSLIKPFTMIRYIESQTLLILHSRSLWLEIDWNVINILSVSLPTLSSDRTFFLLFQTILLFFDRAFLAPSFITWISLFLPHIEIWYPSTSLLSKLRKVFESLIILVVLLVGCVRRYSFESSMSACKEMMNLLHMQMTSSGMWIIAAISLWRVFSIPMEAYVFDFQWIDRKSHN
jgi:hypothetical protein